MNPHAATTRNSSRTRDADALAATGIGHPLPLLSGLQLADNPKKNPTALLDRPEFVSCVTQILFPAVENTQPPTNDQVVDLLRENGIAVRGEEGSTVGYTRSSLRFFIRTIKQRVVSELNLVVADIFGGFQFEMPSVRRSLLMLKQPIAYREFRGNQDAQLARALKCKLTFGGSENLLLSKDSVSRTLAGRIIELCSRSLRSGTTEHRAAISQGERFLDLFLWGRQANYFDNNCAAPPSLELMQKTVGNLTPNAPNKHISPHQIRQAVPWLYQTVCRIVGVADVVPVTGIIALTLDLAKLPKSPRNDWSSRSVRKSFYNQLLAQAGQKLSDFSLSVISDSAAGLSTFYSCNGSPLCTRQTAIALIDEFHPGGCPLLVQDQLIGRRTLAAKEWLILRYYNKTRSRADYGFILDYSHESACSNLLALFGRKLAAILQSGQDTKKIADALNVGRRGMSALRAEFLSGAAQFQGRVNFIRKGSSASVEGQRIAPSKDMLTYADLAQQLMDDNVVKATFGRLADQRFPLSSVSFSDNRLLTLRDTVIQLNTAIDEVDEAQSLALAEKLDALGLELKRDAPLNVKIKAGGRSSEKSIFLTEGQFEKFSALVGEILAELRFTDPRG